MFSKTWIVIKDDTARTFEVITQATNENTYANKAVAMQRDGMNVTCVTIPASNRHASREAISFIGYTREAGLYHRLLKQHNEIILRQAGEW
jgi:putative aminopeptidase FrvX